MMPVIQLSDILWLSLYNLGQTQNKIQNSLMYKLYLNLYLANLLHYFLIYLRKLSCVHYKLNLLLNL